MNAQIKIMYKNICKYGYQACVNVINPDDCVFMTFLNSDKGQEQSFFVHVIPRDYEHVSETMWHLWA